MRKLIIASLALFNGIYAYAVPQDYGVSYDIVYVRYPGTDPDGKDFITIPQGESAYAIAQGADLMLLKPNGTQEVIVDCTTCSVMDPYLSYDATTVYYSKIVNIDTATETDNADSAGYIFKVNISGGAPYTEVQLTFPENFESLNYAGNTDAQDDLGTHTKIRDMAPVPLSDGRVLFTSNRAGLNQFKINASTFGNKSTAKQAVQQLYVMDDHDGTKNTTALSNITRIENSNLTMAQHPMQLKDGRILFTTWLDFGNKFNYSMSPLFTIHPDGSNLQQFTEPHDHNKNLDHYVTQLPTGDVVVDWYYPSFDFGFGVLVRYPIQYGNGQYLRNSFSQLDTSGANFSFREFDRQGARVITPHTTPKDVPAPSRSGKYGMMSWAAGNDMLVSYSIGNVNHFPSKCELPGFPISTHQYPDNNCENLKSGIYLFKNATTSDVTDPTSTAQLAPMVDDPAYNEIWPRAVVTYNSVFGQSAPDIIKSVRKDGATSSYIAKGEPAALVGTSSMLIRESDHLYDATNPSSRETHKGEWRIQGTDVGVFTDSDVYGVRILAIPELPFTSFVSTATSGVYMNEFKNNGDPFNTQMQSRFTSAHSENWEILAEFPLSHKAITDPRGNPDTSWWAKIPSDTPTTIQAIDSNGMTLYSETVWRSMAPGEVRVDCNGCHAHSVEVQPMSWDLGEAGKGAKITGVTGVSNTDVRIDKGFWDLTTGTVPWLAEGGGVEWYQGKSIDIEFTRDIKPIMQTRCDSCHTSGGNNGGFITDGSDGSDLWYTLTNFKNPADSLSTWVNPQISKYIRLPQARASLFVWAAWDARLDGRLNADIGDDVDYPTGHPVLNLPFNEKRLIARWVDLGLPINHTNTENMGYTDDKQLPVIEIFSPQRKQHPVNQGLRVGVYDAQSAIDWTTLSITYYDVATPGTVNTISTYTKDNEGIVSAPLPSLTVGNDYVFTVSVEDSSGNLKTSYSRFTAQAAIVRPAQPTSLGANVQ